MRGKVAISRLPDGSIADEQATKANKAAVTPVKEPPLLPPGEPPLPRLEDDPKRTKPVHEHKATAVSATTTSASEGSVTMGKPLLPRLETAGQPKKKAQHPKKRPEKTAKPEE